MNLRNGDCLIELATIENESIDAVIMDPPYCAGGISEAARTSAKGQGLRSENISRFGWFVGDNMTTAGLIWLIRCVAVESRRLLKDTGHFACFCDWRQAHNLAPAIESAGLRYQSLVVWNKGSMGLGTGFRPQMEVILHFTNGRPEYHNKSTANVLTFNRVNHQARVHQTEKPIALMETLVSLLSPVGGTVLDPFMGSGTTGVACASLGRKFVGIELAAENYAIADARIRAEDDQGKLFFEEPPTPLQKIGD